MLQTPEVIFYNASKLFRESSASDAEQQEHVRSWALRFRLIAVEYAVFGPAFMCLTSAKLFALKRMIDFLKIQYSDEVNRRIEAVERTLLAVLVVATLLLTSCGCACSYFASQIAWLDLRTARLQGMRAQRQEAFQQFQFIQSICFFVEVAVLVRSSERL